MCLVCVFGMLAAWACVCEACACMHVCGGGVGWVGTCIQYLPRCPGGLLVCGIIII